MLLIWFVDAIKRRFGRVSIALTLETMSTFIDIPEIVINGTVALFNLAVGPCKHNNADLIEIIDVMNFSAKCSYRHAHTSRHQNYYEHYEAQATNDRKKQCYFVAASTLFVWYCHIFAGLLKYRLTSVQTKIVLISWKKMVWKNC